MPPKQRGDVYGRGKQRLFRSAVDHVRVGVGCTILGNLSVVPKSASPSAGADPEKSTPCFRAELDELLLSNATPGYKKFRYDAQSKCETMQELLDNRHAIISDLVDALTHTKDEAFFAYLRLSVALFRDLGYRQVVPFFDIFHTVVNRSIYDSKTGEFIPDPQRLQMVFLTQSAWLRDLASSIAAELTSGRLKKQQEPAEEIGEEDDTALPLSTDDGDVLGAESFIKQLVALYAASLDDTKVFIRRLAMEALASLGRRIPQVTRELAAFFATSKEKLVGQRRKLKHDAAKARITEGLSYYFFEMCAGVRGTLHSRHAQFIAEALDAFEAEGVLSDASASVAIALQHLVQSITTGRKPNSGIQTPAVIDLMGSLCQVLQHRKDAFVIERCITAVFTCFDAKVLVDCWPTVSGPQHAQQQEVDHTKPQEVSVAAHVEDLQRRFMEGYAACLDLLARSLRAALNGKEHHATAMCGALQFVSFITATPKIAPELVRPLIEKLLDPVVAINGNGDTELVNNLLVVFLQDVFEKADVNSEVDGPRLPRASWPALCKVIKRLLGSSSNFGEIQFITLATLIQWDPDTLPAMLEADATAHKVEKPKLTKQMLQQLMKGKSVPGFDCKAYEAAKLNEQEIEAKGEFLAPVLRGTFRRGIDLCFSEAAANITPAQVSSFLVVLQQYLSSSSAKELAQSLSKEVVPILTSKLDSLSTRSFATEQNKATRKNTKVTSTANQKQLSVQEQILFVQLWATTSEAASHIEDSVGGTGMKLLRSTLIHVARSLTALSEAAHCNPQDAQIREALTLALKSLTQGLSQRSRSGEADTSDLHSPEQLSQLFRSALQSQCSKFQSVRVGALRLHQQLYPLMQKISLDEDREAFDLRLQYAYTLFDSLLEAEESDALKLGTFDARKSALTRLSFDAEANRVPASLQEIAARAMVGLYFLRFADVWKTAASILVHLLRNDKAQKRLWNDFLSQQAEAALFATDIPTHRSVRADDAGGESTGDDESSSDDDNAGDDVTAGATDGRLTAYVAQPSLTQVRLAEREGMEFEQGLIRWTKQEKEVDQEESDAEGDSSSFVATHDETPTDSSTVAISIGSLLEQTVHYVVAPASDAASSVSKEYLQIEQWLERMMALESSGAEATMKGLGSRLATLLRIFSRIIHPTTSHKDPRAAEKKNWASAFLGYLAHRNSDVQRASLEALKALKHKPYDGQLLEKLLPFCAAPKDLLSHMSSFQVADAIPDDSIREEFVTAAILLSIPKLKEASGQPSKKSRKENANLSAEVLAKRVLEYVSALSSEERVERCLDTVVARLFSTSSFDDNTLQWHNTTDHSTALEVFEAASSVNFTKNARGFRRFVRNSRAALLFLRAMMDVLGSRFERWAHNCLVIALRCSNVLLSQQDEAAWSILVNSSFARKDVRALAKFASQGLTSLLEIYPEEVAAALTSDINLRSAFSTYFIVSTSTLEKALVNSTRIPTALTTLKSIIRSDALRAALIPVIAPEVARCLMLAFRCVLADTTPGLSVGAAQQLQQSRPARGEAALLAVELFSDLLSIGSQNPDDEPSSGVHEQPTSSRKTKKSTDKKRPRAQPTVAKRQPVRAVDPTSGDSTPDPLVEHFLKPHTRSLFSALHDVIVTASTHERQKNTTSSGNARKGHSNSPSIVSARLWIEVMRTVAAACDQLSASAERQEDCGVQLDQAQVRVLFRLSLRFMSSRQFGRDVDSGEVAAEVAVSLASHLRPQMPTTAQDQTELVEFAMTVCRLMNTVTDAAARLQLVAMTRHVFGAACSLDSGFADCAFRLNRCFNSFAEANHDLSTYDFTLRFHVMHSLQEQFERHHDESNTSTIDDAAARVSSRQESGAAEAVPLALKRRRKDASTATKVVHQREYGDDENTTMPAELFQSSQVTFQMRELLLSVVAANLVFFLRDPERSIRTTASRCLASMVQCCGRFDSTERNRCNPAAATAEEDDWMKLAEGDDDPLLAADHKEKEESDDDDHAEVRTAAASTPTSFLDQVVRQLVLPTLRRGIVARDPAIRVEHMVCFGALSKAYPTEFASFASLHHRNSEADFYSLVASSQPKCRLNALAALRHASDSGSVAVRDMLRVFVPFMISSLKDFAQGKSDSSLSAGKAKGFAEATLGTLAHVGGTLPWEAYYYVLTSLIKYAVQEEALRPMMIRAVSKLLENFPFLPVLSGTLQNVETDGGAGDVTAEVDAASSSDASTRQLTGKQQRIVRCLEGIVLPRLLQFILSPKQLEGRFDPSALTPDNRVKTIAAQAIHGKTASATSSLARSSTNVHLPVAIVVAKVLRYVPHGFETHIDPLLTEIVLRLRTKVDTAREKARKILCGILQEAGTEKLRFTLERLRENFVHGYQLHVLGYTVVVLLEALRTNIVAECLDYRKKKEADPTAKIPLPQLDRCVPLIFDILLDDYLGQTGAQKEEIELMSTMLEVKRSRALGGFVFVAEHCVAARSLDMFVKKIRWVLSPSSTDRPDELLATAVSQAKYVNDAKKGGRSVDLRFVERVRALGIRVARAMLDNPSLDITQLLNFAHTQLGENLEIREKKIAEFEAKDGSRGIRENIFKFTAQRKLSQKELFEKNLLIETRPERVDMDFAAHTVLDTMTQQRQKLRKYRGKLGKLAGSASKSFAAEDPHGAVVLDALDEFALKMVVSLLKVLLGLTKSKAVKHMAQTQGEKDGSQSEDEGGKSDDEEKEEDEEEQGMETVRLEAEDDIDYDEEQSGLTRQRRKELESQQRSQASVAKMLRARMPGIKTENLTQLDGLLKFVIGTLEGEGSDAVITVALDAVHGLAALRPPLPAIGRLGEKLFHAVMQMAERGSSIKHRALRVGAAIVSHKSFTLQGEHAQQLLGIVRTELIDQTPYAPMALSMLLAIVSKKCELPEVYNIMPPVTELLLHHGVTNAIRHRCVAILARFVTDYPMTHEKLRSHIDLYLRHLAYPEPSGRLAMLDVLSALVLRLPTKLLEEEGIVFFIPLVNVLTNDDSTEVKGRAAAVLMTLFMNAGIDKLTTLVKGWFQREEKRFHVTAAQLMPLLAASACCLNQDGAPQGKSILTPELMIEALAESPVDNASKKTQIARLNLRQRFILVHSDASSTSAAEQSAEAIKATFNSMQWAIPLMVKHIAEPTEWIDDHRESIRSGKTLKSKEKAPAWTVEYHLLRTVEVLTAFSPVFFEPFQEVIERFVIARALSVPPSGKKLSAAVKEVLSVHPWTQAAAMRLSLDYVQAYAVPKSNLEHQKVLDALQAVDSTMSAQQIPLIGVALADALRRSGKKRARPLQQGEEALEEDASSPRVLTAFSGSILADYESRLKDVLALLAAMEIDESRSRTDISAALQAPQAAHAIDLGVHFARLLCHNEEWQRVANSLAHGRQLLAPVVNHQTVQGYVVRTTFVLRFVRAFLKTQEAAAAVPAVVQEALASFDDVLPISSSAEAASLHHEVEIVAKEILGLLESRRKHKPSSVAVSRRTEERVVRDSTQHQPRKIATTGAGGDGGKATGRRIAKGGKKKRV